MEIAFYQFPKFTHQFWDRHWRVSYLTHRTSVL